MSDAIIKDLERLKTEIEEAKADVAKAEGYLESIMETLSTDFGVSSFKEAMALLKSWEAEEEETSQALETLFDELKTKYDW